MCLQEQSASGQCCTFQCKSTFIKFRFIQLYSLPWAHLCKGSSRQGEYHEEKGIRGSKGDVERRGTAYSKKQEKVENGMQEVVIISLMSRSSFQNGDLHILQLYSSVEKGELLFFLFSEHSVSFSVLSKL